MYEMCSSPYPEQDEADAVFFQTHPLSLLGNSEAIGDRQCNPCSVVRGFLYFFIFFIWTLIFGHLRATKSDEHTVFLKTVIFCGECFSQ